MSRIRAKLKMPPGTPPSNQGGCLSNAEWMLTCEDSQENRMMSIQQADVLCCLSLRFKALEGISHILLLSERAKKPAFFSNSFYCFVILIMLQFYVLSLHPSVTYTCLSCAGLRGGGGLEPIPADTRLVAGTTPVRSRVHHRADM